MSSLSCLDTAQAGMAAEAYHMAQAATSDRLRTKFLEAAKSWDRVTREAERLEGKVQERAT